MVLDWMDLGMKCCMIVQFVKYTITQKHQTVFPEFKSKVEFAIFCGIGITKEIVRSILTVEILSPILRSGLFLKKGATRLLDIMRL